MSELDKSIIIIVRGCGSFHPFGDLARQIHAMAERALAAADSPAPPVELPQAAAPTKRRRYRGPATRAAVEALYEAVGTLSPKGDSTSWTAREERAWRRADKLMDKAGQAFEAFQAVDPEGAAAYAAELEAEARRPDPDQAAPRASARNKQHRAPRMVAAGSV